MTFIDAALSARRMKSTCGDGAIDKLRAVIKTRKSSRILKSERPMLRIDFLRADIKAIEDVYHQHGDLDASAGYHNGGDLVFGADGMLYLSIGDAHDSSLAQNPASLGGKIVRVRPDGVLRMRNTFPAFCKLPSWSSRR